MHSGCEAWMPLYLGIIHWGGLLFLIGLYHISGILQLAYRPRGFKADMSGNDSCIFGSRSLVLVMGELRIGVFCHLRVGGSLSKTDSLFSY